MHAYVADVVNRFPPAVDSVEDDELIAEGMLILIELHARTEPTVYRSFAKFARTALKTKLIDWRRGEMRMRGIGYRNHAHEYVSLDRVSYETLAEASDAADRAGGVSMSSSSYIEPMFHEPAYA